MAAAQEKGRIGESMIFNLLIENNIKASWAYYGSGCDFVTDSGLRIEVKYSSPHIIKEYSKKKQLFIESKKWHFNLHHHGKKQSNIDFFILIQEINETDSNIFVIPANLFGGKTLSISENQHKRGRLNYFLNNWKTIADYKKIA
jgi:hypothetical protein